MAEFCLDCYNKLHGAHYTAKQVKTDIDLCEGCQQVKPVVVAIGQSGPLGWITDIYRRLEALVWSRRQ